MIEKPASTPADSIFSALERQDSSNRSQEAVDAVLKRQLSLFEIGAYWRSDERALPNEYARTAMFTARNKRFKRELIEGKLLFSLNSDISITFTGSELRAADDQLVWQQIIDFAKTTPLGQPVKFSCADMAKNLGLVSNSRTRTDIKNCLARLAAVILMVQSRRHGRIETLRLIKSFRITDDNSPKAKCEVVIQAEMALLFAGSHYTRVEWTKYREISAIARRLYDYASSHRSPFPLPVTSFHNLCSSDQELGKYWNRSVRTACEELVNVGLLDRAFVEDGKIHFIRNQQ